MIAIDDIQRDCPICYDIYDANSFIVFKECQHQLCHSCAMKILFHDKVICPLDRKKIKNVNDYQNERTVLQYQNDIWASHQQSIEVEFEMYWSRYITQTINVVNIIIRTLIENEAGRIAFVASKTGLV